MVVDLLSWKDDFSRGEASRRKAKRIKLAPATMPEREVRKIAAEHLQTAQSGS